jgi:hypothetical protein
VHRNQEFHLSNILSNEDLTNEQIHDLNDYHYDVAKLPRYKAVRDACELLMIVIRDNAPRCADRTKAFQKLRVVRMLANSAIALEGVGKPEDRQ